jgi:glycosyltransferase involved in cell wall biosynthesis
MIDPSLFTIPYDAAICDGLANAGADVHLFGRRLRQTESVSGSLFPLHAFFYELSDHSSLWAPLRPFLKSLEHVFDLLRLVMRIRTERPDIVHFQWSPFPVVDLLAFKIIRRFSKVVLTVHDSEPFNGNPGSRFQLLGYGELLRSADAIIVHTAHAKLRLEQRGVVSNRIAIIAHGILGEPGANVGAPRPGKKQGEIIRILLFGRLKPYKGIDVLVEALGQLPENLRKRVEALVIGEPFFDISQIEGRAADLGLADCIKFEPRRVSDAEVEDLIEYADVLIFPYRQIDASGVLFMALNHRKPVIASRVGAFEEIVLETGNGILVAPDDSHSLAQAITRIVTDPITLSDLRTAAEKIDLDRFSWTAIAQRTIELYRKHASKSDARLS